MSIAVIKPTPIPMGMKVGTETVVTGAIGVNDAVGSWTEGHVSVTWRTGVVQIKLC